MDPVFEGVTITNDANHIETDYVNFVGTYSSVVFDAGTAHKDVLFLGNRSTLYYPDGSKTTTINACRAAGLTRGQGQTAAEYVSVESDQLFQPMAGISLVQ